MRDERPLILVTNDDGMTAPGISALAEAMDDLGEVWVAAPDKNRSGVSHMISLGYPLRAQSPKLRWWSIDGSPVDCVYLAVHALLDRRPDLVVSGINAGPNISYDVHYSGTVGGAREATLLGFPAIAVSLIDPKNGSYEHAADFTRRLAASVLERGLPEGVTLNVNVPDGRPTGHRVTSLGHRLFEHSVVMREDPRGGKYFWIGGTPGIAEGDEGTDCAALESGVISVTPLASDVTASRALPSLADRLSRL